MNNARGGSRIAAVFALILGAGCVDGRRDVAIYRRQLDALPGSTSQLPADYTPLTLHDALRLAEENNESLGLSGEAYIQALAARDLAVSALLPTLSLGPSLSERQPVRGSPGPVHNFNVPLDSTTNLFNIPDQATVAQDTAIVEQNRQSLLNEQQTILLDVVQAYYAVLVAERQVTVYQNSLAEQDERVRQAQAKFRLGNGQPLDIAQSQSTASQTRVQLIQAQAGVKTSRAALAYLIGSPTVDRPLVDGFASPLEDHRPVEAWLSEAQNSRQDVMADAASVQAARQNVRAAIGEYYPSITLNLSYLLYKEGEPLQERLSGVLSANIPIFTGGQIEAQVRTAFSELRAAVLTLRQARKQVEEDVRTAYANLQSSRDQIRELRVELLANRDALVQSQAQYNVGLAINLDVLTALDQLLATQLQLATQVYDEKINYLNLLRVAGRLNLLAAVPATQPSAEPSNLLETTTPDVVRSTTAPAK